MNSLNIAVDRVLEAQEASGKPLAIILAGHNGSGKSTMWKKHLSDKLQMPLINADRMMVSILPEANRDGFLVDWAGKLRDENKSWMRVAQRGVQAFVAQAMGESLPFAMETVFSHWEEQRDGNSVSKIDLIRDLQNAGYFVLLCFVGLSNAQLSIARVHTRVAEGGHGVDIEKLLARFPRTQKAIAAALAVADAAILVDNSLEERKAFSVCRIQLGEEAIYDVRDGDAEPAVNEWLDRVAPREQAPIYETSARSDGFEIMQLIQGQVMARQLASTEADLMHTIFPHPTLSEMMHESVLDAFGRAVHYWGSASMDRAGLLKQDRHGNPWPRDVIRAALLCRELGRAEAGSEAPASIASRGLHR